MVAIRMTSKGPEVDPVARYELHPVLELFEERDEAAEVALERDLKENGQAQPIILDIHGRLVDGRARLRALHRLGIRPVVRTLIGDESPWLTGLRANLDRIADLPATQRAWYAARIPARPQRNLGFAGRDPYAYPPKLTDVCEILDVSPSTIVMVRKIMDADAPEVLRAVSLGLLPASTAMRALAGLDPHQVRMFALRVLNGANPDHLVTALGVPPFREHHRKPVSLPQAAERAVRTPGRHRYVNLPAIETAIISLRSLTMVTDGGEPLDPAITAEQAAELLKTLSRYRRSLSTVTKLLKEREGSKQ